jgi:Flp pilus assembly pilin Flp
MLSDRRSSRVRWRAILRESTTSEEDRVQGSQVVRRLYGEHAQGTVEYVALIALVALIMVGVIAAIKTTQFAEGQQLGSLILRKIAEAVSKVHY